MNLIADRNGQPSQVTQVASHLLVGAVAAIVAQQVQGPEVALAAFVVVALMHAYFDAPVAKVLVNALA
jgi:hypothetical protein